MHTGCTTVFTRVSGLLLGLGALAVAHASEPQPHWLQEPCALLQESDYARVLPAPSAALQDAPYVGRRSSECLWTETGADRSLRLVLHPARDAARVAIQLQRMQGTDAAAVRFETDGAAALITGDRRQLSIGVGAWMISVNGSEPLDEAGARQLASALVQRVVQSQATP